jgi:hypothetical protein
MPSVATLGPTKPTPHCSDDEVKMFIVPACAAGERAERPAMFQAPAWRWPSARGREAWRHFEESR